MYNDFVYNIILVYAFQFPIYKNSISVDTLKRQEHRQFVCSLCMDLLMDKGHSLLLSGSHDLALAGQACSVG